MRDDGLGVLVGVLEVRGDGSTSFSTKRRTVRDELVTDLRVGRHGPDPIDRLGTDIERRGIGTVDGPTLDAHMAMHQTMMGFRRDPDAVRGRKIERELAPPRAAASPGRTAAPDRVRDRRRSLAAVVAVVPPLLFRALLDNAVPEKNRDARAASSRSRAVGLAIASARARRSLQRWYSAAIGEGLIYDLRVALFDHVQRLPLSFFTRTQTGALMSRLNNDVIGAQQAVTNTLGTVVSNVITLVVTLTRHARARVAAHDPHAASCSRRSSSRRGASAGSSRSRPARACSSTRR